MNVIFKYNTVSNKLGYQFEDLINSLEKKTIHCFAWKIKTGHKNIISISSQVYLSNTERKITKE